MTKPVREKISLHTDDWNDLFPKQDYVIGSTKFKISPLCLEEIKSVMDKLRSISLKIAEMITSKNSNEETKVIEILDYIVVVLDEAPEILSDMSGMEVNDVKSLPLDKAVELFTFCLDINIKSQESLSKNFRGLAEKMQKFTGTIL